MSSCLLGEAVRFDGGHKHDRFLTDVLGPYVEWVPVCPELEVGMGVPRESVRLEARPLAHRLPLGPPAAPQLLAPGTPPTAWARGPRSKPILSLDSGDAR